MTEADAIVASWSREWRSALPVRTPAEQSALLAETREVVAALQQAARTNGSAGHALHRKSILESSNARVGWRAGSSLPSSHGSKPLRTLASPVSASWG